MISSPELVVSKSSMRLVALTIAMVVYALFGDPTPDRITLALVIVGVGLLIFVEPTGTAKRALLGNAFEASVTRKDAVSDWIFLALLGYPTLVGAMGPWESRDIIRDVVPHVFLFLPILISRHRDRARLAHTVLPALVSIVGVTFSVRYLRITGASILEIGQSAFLFDGLLGLTFDPSVMFAAIWLPFAGIRQLQPASIRSAAVAVSCVVGSLACLAALGANVVRLPIVLIVLGWALLLVRSTHRHPLATAAAGVALLGGALLRYRAQVAGLGRLIFEKQVLTGDNGRLIEWTVVIDTVSRGPASLLFGDGWGALIQTPGYRVAFSFTHNVFSYYLFKAGVVGLILISIYWLVTLRGTNRTFQEDPVLAVAAGLSLANAGLVQPTFKAMTFGLILAALSLANIEGRTPKADRRATELTRAGFWRVADTRGVASPRAAD